MLNALKRSIQLINKDEFDTSLYKVVCVDDVNKPKEKHLNLVIACLIGENKRVLPLDAFTRITDQILEIKFQKWIAALKWCYVLHVCIYSNCKVFVEAMCHNGMFTRVRSSQPKVNQEDILVYLHSTLALNYFTYLQNRYENLIYFQNAMDDFDQKEENQKALIIHKVAQTLHLILKMEKELTLSLQKFQQFLLIRHIGYFLLRDMSFFYPIICSFVNERFHSLKTMEISLAQRIYQSYTDLIRMSRHVKSMILLKPMVTEGMTLEEENLILDIKLFNVDAHTNQDIELYFKEQENQQKKINTVKKQHSQDQQQTNSTECTPLENHYSTQTSEIPKPKLGLRHYSQPPDTQQEIIEIVQFDIEQYVEEPKKYSELPLPDKIVVPKDRVKPTRLTFTKPRDAEGFSDNTTYQSATTQHSFISEYSEGRVMGISRQGSIKPKQAAHQAQFYNTKQSPLGFLQPLSQQPSVKELSYSKK